jgi:isochorismate synthase EntC
LDANLGAISTITTDYLTKQVVRKYYKNQWDMSSDEFIYILDRAQIEVANDREKIIINWQKVDKVAFVESFMKAQAAFKAGEVKKVVPFSVQRGNLEQPVTLSQKISLLRNLAATPEELYAYGEWFANRGFMGATPEVLFEKSGHNLQTMALAGTSGKDINPVDFLNDPKERKEHQFVVDDIAEILGSLGNVRVGATTVIEFPALNHLETRLSVDLTQSVSTDELINKMHPTSALGIYPRNAYFEKFCQYPLQSERGFYGAPWGFETKESALLLVAIRKWDWSERDVKIFAGCGVVQESILEKEFAEILKKIDSVKRIFFQD